MKTIGMAEFEELVQRDDALRAALRACPDEQTALETAGRLAAARGYHLAATAGMQPLSDDALDSVAGGFDPARLQAEQEINPYSWFVTILRRLMGEDGEEELL
ncbi:MAG: hypothetical protein IJS79_01975 [Oscillospiraceae bacterium]|nr:hypothetical protein [Oscillospiraceae bacterium]